MITGPRTTEAVWRGPQALAALGVIALMLVWRAVLIGDSFFNQDDYYLTSRALDADVSWSFLMEPVAGHVMPAQHLAYWLVAHYLPFDWPTMALFLLLAQAASVVVMWHLLTRLLPGRWVRVPLLAVFAWSPMTLATGLWWSAAMGLWPHVLFSLLGMLFLVRAIQGAGSWWLNLAGCVAVTAFALTWHERARARSRRPCSASRSCCRMRGAGAASRGRCDGSGRSGRPSPGCWWPTSSRTPGSRPSRRAVPR